MSITAIVENHAVKLPLHVPDGTRVEITVPEVAPADTLHRHDWMRKYIGSIQDLPEDFAAEHDHYLHGTPKQAAP